MARTSGLANLTMKQLAAELTRRQKALPALLEKKATLEKQVAVLDGQIADLSGEAAHAGTIAKKAKGLAGKRKASGTPPREGSLKWHLVKALVGTKGLGIGEAVAAVAASGYKSQSKDFRLLVNQTLLNEPEFRKVRRGIFTVKSQPETKSSPTKAAKPGRKPKAAGKPAAKANRGKPLAAYVAEALAGAPDGLAIREIEKAVLAAGYATKSKNLYNPIGAALGKVGAKKVARGVYAVAKKPGRKPGTKRVSPAAPVAEDKKA
ncbi:MAG: hypothetical protein WCK05_07665 [Planctomycetota bacterium]